VDALENKLSLFLNNRLLFPGPSAVQEYLDDHYSRKRIASRLLDMIEAASRKSGTV
jgi:hypothetical protein